MRKQRRKITRDSILFVCGLGGIAFETVIEHVDRPYLLLLFAYMVGLPVVSGSFVDAYRQLRKNENAEVVTD